MTGWHFGNEHTASPPPSDDRDRDFSRLGEEPPPQKPKRRVEILPFAITGVGLFVIALFIWLTAPHFSRAGSHFGVSWGSPPDCLDSSSGACRQVDPTVAATYDDINACSQPQRVVCIVPVGGTTPEMIEAMASRLAQYEGSLSVAIAPPLPLSDAQLNAGRNQYDAEAIIELASETYADRLQDGGGLLLALTPADIYLPDRPQWRFAFGTVGASEDDYRISVGVVSSLRMSLIQYWRPVKLPLGANLDIVIWPSHGKVESRAYKMLLKYVGRGFYGLSLSPDPHSVMYNNILSVRDLDRMDDELPIAFQ